MTGRRAMVCHARHTVGTLSENPPGSLYFSYNAHWLTSGGFAVSLGLLRIPQRPTMRRLAELAESLPPLAQRVAADFVDQHGHATVLERFAETVQRRCRQVLNSVF